MTEEGEPGGPRPEGAPAAKRAWMVVACVLLVASAALLWRGYAEATFVVATLGVLAWFLNVRANLPRREEED